MIRAWMIRVASVLVLALVSPRLEAQCAPPDGLDGGPCCASALLNIPRPKFTQAALGICWQNCGIDATSTYQATWTALQPGLSSGGTAPCGWFTVGVQLSTGAITKWTGKLQATYARTWVETAPSGTLVHVWRFLVNGDLYASSAAGSIPCPVPPCVPVFSGRARFTGYVDYARDCGTGLWQFAWMLTHACDAVDHDIGYPRGGTFHPDRAYTFLGPAAGFVPGAVQPSEAGATPFEYLRRWKVPPPGATGPVSCESEERLINAMVNPVNQGCLCGSSGTPQYVFADLMVNGACGSTIQGFGPGSLPFISMGIGTWTNPGVYPGIQTLRWNTNFCLYTDPCSGTIRDEYFFGVSTLGGFPANQYLASGIGPPLPRTFVDQCNSMLFPGGVLTRNVPFQSDHIFGLNLP